MKKTVKTICAFLIFFSTGFLYAQNLKVEISAYPSNLDKVMKQYEGINDNDLEVWKFDLDGNERRTRGGWKGFYGKYTSASDPIIAFGAEVKDTSKGQIVITDIKNSYKKYGEIKVKTDGASEHLEKAFTSNGEHLIAFGLNGGELYYYAYALDAKKLVIKGQKITMDRAVETINSVGASGINDWACLTTQSKEVIIIDTKSFTGKTYSGTKAINPNTFQRFMFVYPSLVTDHFLLSSRYSRTLFDVKKMEVVYTTPIEDRSESIKSFFIKAEGSEIEKDISAKSLSGPGIGLVMTKESVLVFDQDQNYFALGNEEGKEPSVLEQVSFNGQHGILESQPDPIPIISDVLNAQNIAKLFEHTGKMFEKNDSRALAFKVYESAQPFNEELISSLSKSEAQYIIEYVGKYVAQWINNTSKITLAEDGKEFNIKRGQFLDSYAMFSKELSQEEYGMYLASDTEIQNAQEKIKPLQADLFYMSVDELMAKGNNAIKMVPTMGSKAALLAIKFYEVAAEKEPTEPVYPILIGNAYANADDYDNALAYYNKALAIRPDYPLALFGLTKTSFMPVQKGQKALDDNLAKSIIRNANRFLAVAPDDYISETKSTNIYKSICQLYVDDQGLYAAYNLATGLSETEKRVNAVSTLIPKVKATGNTFLTAYLANVNGFDYIKVAESKGNNVNDYKQADAMLAQSVKGGVYDAETYYKWAQININFLDKKTEGMRIVSEAQKQYPEDKNFGSLMANDYFNKGREYYLKKSYSSAIPLFEKYIANAKNIVPKAYDYLGFSYYYTKNYVKAAENLQLVKDKNDVNTLLAYNPNFNEVLAYAKSRSGTRPIPKDNGDQIVAMEDLYMKGNDMARAGQTNEGLKLMEEAAAYYDLINYDYGQAITHNGVGVTYHNADDISNAKSHYETCVESGPQSSTCYYNLALILINEEQISKAKSLVNEGLRAYPNAEDLAKAKQYLNE